VLPRPEKKLAVQIGDGPALAKAIHIPVMHDFRAADVEAGGQGAPFVPVYHRALAQSLEREGPIAVLNIGGVSNITYIDGTDTLIACDTGPGNALLDDFMYRVMSQRFDCEGRMAAQGAADEAWISRALELPFFRLPPPKSLDRNHFSALKLGDVKPADGAATLTAFTAAAIAKIVPLLPKPPKSWIVAGGGARNITMLRMLRDRLEPATVESADVLGWATDAIEAQAFGFLAARGLKGLPLSYPATTGVPMPMTGGVVVRREDGEVALFESNVICEYIEDTQAGAKLHPQDPLKRAQHRAWMEFGSTILSELWGLETTGDPVVFETKRVAIAAKFARVEQALGSGPFFAVETFSLVDDV